MMAMGTGSTFQGSVPAIPHKLHFIWLGEDMPKHLRAYVRTWQHYHPSWPVRFWSEDTIPKLHNQELWDAACDIAGKHMHQFRADVLRYEILHEYGGVYVDCDFEAKRSIGNLLDNITCFAAWEEPDVWVNNAIMGSVPGHPFLRALIDGLSHHIATWRGPGIRPNVLSGPQYLTGIYEAHKGDVKVYPKEWFYPYLWNELNRGLEEYPDAYAVHHWHNARKRAIVRV